MSIVPANSGTAPKLPVDPTWSARMAVCGLQLRPKRNSVTGTSRKKRIASNTTERTIPTVVRMAMLEAATNNTSTNRSTRLRARKSGEILLQANTPPNTASAILQMANRRRLVALYSTRRAEVSINRSSACMETASPAVKFLTLFRNSSSSAGASDRCASGRP